MLDWFRFVLTAVLMLAGLFVLLVGVHARSAILLLCCVPLIPLSIDRKSVV